MPSHTVGEFGKDGKYQMSHFLHLLYKIAQLIGIVVVAAYYGTDLTKARKAETQVNGAWAFAVFVAALSGVLALLQIFVTRIWHYRTTAMLFFIDWLVTVLWGCVTAIFGSKYFQGNSGTDMDSNMGRMKIAAGFDVVELIMWFLSATCATYVFLRKPEKPTETEITSV